MAIKNPDQVLAAMVELINERLAEDTAKAKAAGACAAVNNIDEAIRITLDIDQPIYEVTTLLNAASLIKRLSDEDA